MTRDDAVQEIRSKWRYFFPPDKSKKGIVCPICGNGSGSDGDGIRSNPKSKKPGGLICFKCGFKGDILDLLQQTTGGDYNTVLRMAADQLNITIDPYRQTAADDFKKAPQKATGAAGAAAKPSGDSLTAAAAETQQSGTQESTATDYTEYFKECRARLTDPAAVSYLQARGISPETAAAYWVGFDPAWKHPKAPAAVKTTPRLIIPTSTTSYLARDTRANLEGQAKQYAKSKVGSVHLYNPQALKKNIDVLFITEGEIDALSIIEAGGEAVGLGSAGNYRKLVKLLEEKAPLCPLILALDNDEAGRKTTEELKKELHRLGIEHCDINLYGEAKDANEALTKDRAALERAIAEAKARAAEEARAEQEAEREEYLESSVSNHLEAFRQNIKDSAKATFSPTGFSELDRILDGGLYAGLYIIGAISSLGKTTFCLQVCDQIAAAGRDVIIFSLEMAKDELIAKSISRLSYVEAMERHGTSAAAKTTRGVLTGSRWEYYNADELEVLEAAINNYSGYAGHIFIHEGVGNIGVEQVKETIEKHVRVTGSRPVVLIDYLQILAPYDPRSTDKQNTDKAVLELKRLSRDFSIPIIGISSFNRENYTAPVNMASFKESGAVEYSSDVLMGIQYDGMDWQRGESEKERNKRIRALFDENIANGRAGKPQRLQLKVLKNRNGTKGNAYIDFISMFNYFVSHGQPLPGSGTQEAAQDPKKEDFHQMTADEWITFEGENSPFIDL